MLARMTGIEPASKRRQRLLVPDEYIRILVGEPGGIRTHDAGIKSPAL